MLDEYVKKILNSHVYDVAHETPLELAKSLSKRLNNQILLKREDLQPVFSFKLRGAYNKMAGLTKEQLANGVITASAGNHAQGVAMAAQRANIKAIIVMPKTTPRIKIEAVRSYGAQIELVGNTYDDAHQYAKSVADEKSITFVHPYDDPDVIAGQGTVAFEILKQHSKPIHAIFVPVGGGGLISGIATYVKYLRPEIKIIGVEPDDAPCLYEAMKAGERVILDQVGIFADGVAVRQIGEETFRIARQLVDDVILVSTDEICAAIKDIFDDTRSIAEPAGALGVAGVKKYLAKHGISNETLVAIDSGANINFDRLRHVAERAELGEHREAILAVTIPEKPGAFRTFCKTLGPRGITEFNYRYSHNDQAHIFVGIQLQRGDEERREIIKHLQDLEYPILDMTDNETAKLHIRYMVGGRTDLVDGERLFRFEFPERPGALLRFLNRIGDRWNISMFHYRNHGAAYGRVLAGIQIPEADNEDFYALLNEVGYPYSEETENPAYRLFLK